MLGHSMLRIFSVHNRRVRIAKPTTPTVLLLEALERCWIQCAAQGCHQMLHSLQATTINTAQVTLTNLTGVLSGSLMGDK